ncbi:uncharacterized protein LOC134208945 [Armigeres subalbatus]|uniref:uncharacterized protein LOC134208945 n=1 Tax=Armigeres subalbatus TaxID=124917 RepID=UPI002ED036B0
MELYYEFLLDGFRKLGPEEPVLQNTVFGWVAAGKVGFHHHAGQPKVAHVCSMEKVEDTISRFWELESCWSPCTQSPDETFCEEHFVANTFRDESGRFVVTLPKRTDVLSQLGRSKNIAVNRFHALERRLDANPNLKQAYTAFITEYLQLNHMREINDVNDSFPSYYLPHNGVEKADSTTTKLRVVFDASCRTDSGVSLNQALLVGPVVQDDLYAISLRFRMRQYAIVADAEKMYRQIRVHPTDFLLQRILWRNSSREQLKTFELTTVIYGTASAPYLATRCLLELSKQGSNDFPQAAEILAKDFYIDDMLTGVEDEDDGAQLCIQLRNLLKSAGFSLRKWASNSNAILSAIPSELRDERSMLALDTPSTIKTLGLIWEPATDLLHYTIPKWSLTNSITRRTVLSDTAKLFDPLGLVGPVIVLAKIFVQTLWRSSHSWDDPLDDHQQQYWLAFRNSLDALPSISVPRWVAFANAPVNVELHGFCDASIRAYGACLYIRTVSNDGGISVRLLTAKSKVAPLGDSKRQKRVSLPRLELSAALLLSHLYHKVNSSIALNTRSFFWSDSTITPVLCLIIIRRT